MQVRMAKYHAPEKGEDIVYSRCLISVKVLRKQGYTRKAKIGQEVKGIPGLWVKRQRITEEDSDEMVAWKELMNRCLLNKRPYFFIYRYEETRKEYEAYKKNRSRICEASFGMTVDELISAPVKTEEQREWLRNYYEFSPVIESDSTMNMLCRYLEQVDFDIRSRIRAKAEFDPTVYIDESCPGWQEHYEEVVRCYQRYLRDMKSMVMGTERQKGSLIDKLTDRMSFVCPSPVAVTNCLVRYLLCEKKTGNVETLWLAYGKYMVRNAALNAPQLPAFPLPDEDGPVLYMGKRYAMKEVEA